MQKRRIVLFETGNNPHNPTNSKDIIMTSTALPTMTLQGINAATGKAVTEEVAFKLSSNSLTASCKKVVADAKKHAKSDQKNEDNDVRAIALVSVKVIAELAKAKKIIILDSVRATIYSAAGYDPKSSDIGYRKMANRSKRGIQAAMMAYNSPAHRLDALGNLEAHANQLKSTFVFKDDQGNVINKSCANTLEFNDKAEDFTFVGQSAYDNQMQKLGLAEKKGADKREKAGATGSEVKLSPEEKILHGITACITLTDYIRGMTTAKGNAPKLETLSFEQFELVQAALNLESVVRQAVGLKPDQAFLDIVATKTQAAKETLAEVA